MPYDLIVIAHHVGAVALIVLIGGGAVLGRALNAGEARKNALAVEGMGGMAAVLFQVVSGANLTGRSEVSWGEPWVTVTLALLGLAVVAWLISIGRRMKNDTGSVPLGLSLLAAAALGGAYGVMTMKAPLPILG